MRLICYIGHTAIHKMHTANENSNYIKAVLMKSYNH